MCWKCENAILKLDDGTTSHLFVGEETKILDKCKGCEKIINYDLAKIYCPLKDKK
jgi:hypothetical protein